MKKYTKDEIKEFLLKLDEAVDQPVRIVVIGGSAAVLKYEVIGATKDIDYIDDEPSLEVLLKGLSNKLDSSIPIEKVNVHDVPWNYQDRLVEEKSFRLKNLQIFYPEVHDLILMKSIRSNENDIQMIEEICKKNEISSEMLKSRAETEMGHVHGDPKRLQMGYEISIETAQRYETNISRRL